MGFIYLPGPILVTLRPRLLTVEHLADLRHYADNLWQGSPALMVSDGLFSFGADLLDEEF